MNHRLESGLCGTEIICYRARKCRETLVPKRCATSRYVLMI